MATIQEMDERIEKQKAELAKLEAKKKELQKKERERNRKWKNQVVLAAGESVLSAVGCDWHALNLTALDEFLSGFTKEELRTLFVLKESTPESAKQALDARKKPKKGEGTIPEPPSENSAMY